MACSLYNVVAGIHKDQGAIITRNPTQSYTIFFSEQNNNNKGGFKFLV